MFISSIKIKENKRIIGDTITFKDTITVLSGVNGSGKTSVLNRIAMEALPELNSDSTYYGLLEQLDVIYDSNTNKDSVHIFPYSNSHDNFNIRDFQREGSGQSAIEHRSLVGFVEGIAGRFDTSMMSEGQASRASFLTYLGHIKLKLKNELPASDGVVLLLDELDSGISIATINAYMHILMDLVKSNPGRVQIIMTTNNYEFTKLGKTFYLDSMTYEDNDTYESFADRMIAMQIKFIEENRDVL